MMPNKTIYVSEADLPIYEEAQDISGESLSATVSKALHLFVSNVDSKKRGFEAVKLEVGRKPYKLKQFQGRSIATWEPNIYSSFSGSHVAEYPLHKNKRYEVYLTPKGNLVVHTATHINPLGTPILDVHSYSQLGQVFGNVVEYKMDVYQTIGDMERHIPTELYDKIATNLMENSVEELDI